MSTIGIFTLASMTILTLVMYCGILGESCLLLANHYRIKQVYGIKMSSVAPTIACALIAIVYSFTIDIPNNITIIEGINLMETQMFLFCIGYIIHDYNKDRFANIRRQVWLYSNVETMTRAMVFSL